MFLGIPSSYKYLSISLTLTFPSSASPTVHFSPPLLLSHSSSDNMNDAVQTQSGLVFFLCFKRMRFGLDGRLLYQIFDLLACKWPLKYLVFSSLPLLSPLPSPPLSSSVSSSSRSSLSHVLILTLVIILRLIATVCESQ